MQERVNDNTTAAQPDHGTTETVFDAPAELAAHTVETKLRRAWRKERRFHHGNGLAHFLLWALALVLTDLLVDWLFLIPGTGRMALLTINAGTLAWVLWHYWLRDLRRYDPVRVALQVERQHPKLESLLVSFVQLRGDVPQAAHASPGLIRALQRQTVEATRPLDFREIISYRELKRIFMLAACVVAFFALYSVNWSEHLRVLLLRMVNPTSELTYPTRTTIDWVTGDVTVRQGDPVTLAARASGRIPPRGTLWVRPKEGEWEKLVVFPGDTEPDFAYRFGEVFQEFDYRMRLGDARSERHTVSVIPPPRIVDTRVRLRFPTYTRQRPKVVDFLNLEVPEGTAIEWELTCDLPLASAEMLRNENDARAMALADGGRVARLTEMTTGSFSYQFRWKEQEHGYEYEDEIHYFVGVVPDAPPQVEIVAPAEDNKATVRKTLAVNFLARDDYGVAKAWLVYRLNDDEEKRRPIGTFADALVEADATWTLRQPDSLPGLKVGDVVTYAVEVADAYSGECGPHLSRSDTRRLFIVSVQDYLSHMLEKRRRLRTELEGMHQQEKEAETEVGKLKDEAPDPPNH